MTMCCGLGFRLEGSGVLNLLRGLGLSGPVTYL